MKYLVLTNLEPLAKKTSKEQYADSVRVILKVYGLICYIHGFFKTHCYPALIVSRSHAQNFFSSHLPSGAGGR